MARKILKVYGASLMQEDYLTGATRSKFVKVAAYDKRSAARKIKANNPGWTFVLPKETDAVQLQRF
jgi:hypothetical protein